MSAQVTLEAILEYDPDLMHGDDVDAIIWFINDVLLFGKNVLHNNDPIGDCIGELTITKVVSD